jgi:hypothetical protein
VATNIPPYLTASEIAARLASRYNITATIAPADAEAASNELDAMRPFIGWRFELDPTAQPRQFPRNIEPDLSESDGTIPDAILDTVALLAYAYELDEGPPVKQEGAGGASITYAYPKRNLANRRIEELMRPYMRKRGQVGHYRPSGERETLQNPYLDYYPL